MRLGVNVSGDAGLASLTDQLRRIEGLGFHSAWMAQIFSVDALTAFAVTGTAAPRLELGTAVVPTYPRHPTALAAQALTVQAATGNRLTLGIGLSHRVVIENMFGLSYERPAKHMQEYLSVLMPLLHDRSVQFSGQQYRVNAFVDVPDVEAPPVLLAALAPRMLQLAGEVADGTATWMTGPATIANHIAPSITKAAAGAGRPAPRIVVSLPVCVTNDPDGARQRAATEFAVYKDLPSYRAMLDKEGAEGPADVAIVGDEGTVVKAIEAIAECGATDFVTAPFGSREDIERTLAVVAGLG